ncbi:MAG: L-fuculose-phosphate aldolase [Aliivibrio sp.]|uniref:L-fuculose-phosphate aldolase n=1 Tax=Aliivibrio sp. TaxID=1872443 RepID=UPI001A5E2BF8|nr:L-fuculose-phosphate aldolase [Aliivibrio sp.]
MNRETLSQEIIDTCIEMNRLGLNQGTSGNISSRFKDGMLITPSGVPYQELSPDDIVFINSKGYFDEHKVPSSEWHFHKACYQARPELNAVVHNHAVHSTSVSILNKSIPAIHYMVAVSGTDSIPCIGYETFGSQALSDRVENGIKLSKALLMQHHGMIVAEVNLQKALWLAQEIEILAEQFLNILSITSDVPVLSPQEMKKVLEKFKSYGLRVNRE